MSRLVLKNQKLRPRKSKFRSSKVRLYFVSMLLTVFVGVTITITYEFLITSPIFYLQEVNVKGNKLLPEELILKMADLPKKKNLFSIDTKRAKEAILKLRIIENISFKKHFPQTMEITVKENVPIAMLLFKSKLYYLDKGGNVLSKVNSKLLEKMSNKLDYPIITGIDDNFTSIERTNFIKLALKLLNEFSISSIYKDVSISEVLVNKGSGLSVITTKKNLPIFFGFDKFARKLKFLSFVLSDLEKKQLNISKINLDFQKIVVVKKQL